MIWIIIGIIAVGALASMALALCMVLGKETPEEQLACIRQDALDRAEKKRMKEAKRRRGRK